MREVLRYGALLSMPSKLTKRDKYRRVEDIIDMLDIRACSDSRIGEAAAAGGISGGERRRLAVGMELLFDPHLLLLG